MILSKTKIYIVPTISIVTKETVAVTNALQLELIHYNIILSSPLVEALRLMEISALKTLSVDILKSNTIGQNLNPPLFSNWENRNDYMSIEEITIQMFGYITQLSGNDLYDDTYMKKLHSDMLSKINISELTTINLATAEEARLSLQKDHITTQHRSQSTKAKGLTNTSPNEYNWIPNPQARTLEMISQGNTCLVNMKLSAHDVLRYFGERYNEGFWVLPSDVKYTNMTWKERVLALEFLSNIPIEVLLEKMGQNRNAWTKFFNHIKLFKQKQFRNKFKNLIAYVHISQGNTIKTVQKNSLPMVKFLVSEGIAEIVNGKNLAYRTFSSRVMSAVESKDYPLIDKLMRRNFNFLLREISTISNAVTKDNNIAFLSLCREAISKANFQTLISILQINVNSEYRIIDVKGNTTVQKANYSPIIRSIQQDIENEIYNRYGKDGQITYDSSLKDKVVPFLAKNQELDRGSKIQFNDTKYIHFFMKWTQESIRTDLDHSWLCVDIHNNMSSVYFRNQSNSYIKQSGDITSAPKPNGASEYSVISLNNIPDDIKYIVPVINVFSGENFSECSEAYAGFMFSDSNSFNINKDHVRYNLSQPAQVNSPFVIDVRNKEIVILDFNCRESRGSIATDYNNEVLMLIEASKTLNKMTVSKFCNMLSGQNKDIVCNVTTVPKKNTDLDIQDLSILVE